MMLDALLQASCCECADRAGSQAAGWLAKFSGLNAAQSAAACSVLCGLHGTRTGPSAWDVCRRTVGAVVCQAQGVLQLRQRSVQRGQVVRACQPGLHQQHALSSPAAVLGVRVHAGCRDSVPVFHLQPKSTQWVTPEPSGAASAVCLDAGHPRHACCLRLAATWSAWCHMPSADGSCPPQPETGSSHTRLPGSGPRAPTCHTSGPEASPAWGQSSSSASWPTTSPSRPATWRRPACWAASCSFPSSPAAASLATCAEGANGLRCTHASCAFRAMITVGPGLGAGLQGLQGQAACVQALACWAAICSFSCGSPAAAFPPGA